MLGLPTLYCVLFGLMLWESIKFCRHNGHGELSSCFLTKYWIIHDLWYACLHVELNDQTTMSPSLYGSRQIEHSIGTVWEGALLGNFNMTFHPSSRSTEQKSRFSSDESISDSSRRIVSFFETIYIWNVMRQEREWNTNTVVTVQLLERCKVESSTAILTIWTLCRLKLSMRSIFRSSCLLKSFNCADCCWWFRREVSTGCGSLERREPEYLALIFPQTTHHMQANTKKKAAVANHATAVFMADIPALLLLILSVTSFEWLVALKPVIGSIFLRPKSEWNVKYHQLTTEKCERKKSSIHRVFKLK